MIALALAVAAASPWLGGGPAEAAVWEPVRTRALLVSVLETQEARLPPLPKAGRQDRALERTLKERGVAPDRLVFLADAEASGGAIRRELRKVLASAVPGDTVLLYFAGQTVQRRGEYFFAGWDFDPDEPAQTGLSAADLAAILKSDRHGARLLLLAEGPRSGALASIVPALADTDAPAAGLASMSELNDAPGGWTFTEAVVAALGGDGGADLDGDGAVTFADAERFVAAEVRARQDQMTGGARTPDFEPDFVLSPAGRGERRQYAESRWRARWYRVQVLEAKGDARKVRYLGYGSRWDEWVGPDRLRDLPDEPPAAAGEKIEVDWEDRWFPAAVVKTDGPFCLVHYEGYGRENDEWVGAKRLRRPGARP